MLVVNNKKALIKTANNSLTLLEGKANVKNKNAWTATVVVVVGQPVCGSMGTITYYVEGSIEYGGGEGVHLLLIV